MWVRKGDNVNPLVIGRERKRDWEERERERERETERWEYEGRQFKVGLS